MARILCLVLCLLAGCSSAPGAAPSATGGGPATYGAYAQSYTVPWVGAPDFSHLTRTLKVKASVNGGDVSSYTVDTGSVGMVVPASEVPNIPAGSPSGGGFGTAAPASGEPCRRDARAAERQGRAFDATRQPSLVQMEMEPPQTSTSIGWSYTHTPCKRALVPVAC
jgi:hypothetical protein